VDKTAVIYVTFLLDVACQKLLKLANVSRSYSKNNTGTVFFETRCTSKSCVNAYLYYLADWAIGLFCCHSCPKIAHNKTQAWQFHS